MATLTLKFSSNEQRAVIVFCKVYSFIHFFRSHAVRHL